MSAATLFSAIAQTRTALHNCEARLERNPSDTQAEEWANRHRARLSFLYSALPSGAGFDNGTKIDDGACEDRKLVFRVDFHHMSDHGFYCGWTEHVVTVEPDWEGVQITVSTVDPYEEQRCCMPDRTPAVMPEDSSWTQSELEDYIAETFANLTPDNDPSVARVLALH